MKSLEGNLPKCEHVSCLDGRSSGVFYFSSFLFSIFSFLYNHHIRLDEHRKIPECRCQKSEHLVKETREESPELHVSWGLLAPLPKAACDHGDEPSSYSADLKVTRTQHQPTARHWATLRNPELAEQMN